MVKYWKQWDELRCSKAVLFLVIHLQQMQVSYRYYVNLYNYIIRKQNYIVGLYQCVAVNSAGRAWVSAQLIPYFSESRPSPPQNVQCRSFDDSSICLMWDPPTNVTIQAYSVYAFSSGRSLSQFLLFNIITIFDIFSFHCWSSNSGFCYQSY